MNSIIKGTTPTIKFTFQSVNVSEIAVAYLTIKGGEQPIEKDLTSAVIGSNYLAWTLTQAETLGFGGTISVMLNWKLENGVRGASAKQTFLIDSNYKAIVI